MIWTKVLHVDESISIANKSLLSLHLGLLDQKCDLLMTFKSLMIRSWADKACNY